MYNSCIYAATRCHWTAAACVPVMSHRGMLARPFCLPLSYMAHCPQHDVKLLERAEVPWYFSRGHEFAAP